jgi:hypothetical protein
MKLQGLNNLRKSLSLTICQDYTHGIKDTVMPEKNNKEIRIGMDNECPNNHIT